MTGSSGHGRRGIAHAVGIRFGVQRMRPYHTIHHLARYAENAARRMVCRVRPHICRGRRHGFITAVCRPSWPVSLLHVRRGFPMLIPQGTTMTTTPSSVGSTAARADANSGRAARSARSTDLPGVGLAPVRGRRRPWLLGLGALLASLGALTVVWLVGAAGQRQEVLAVRADVAYGEVVTADDITIARVSVDPGVAVLPGDTRDAVVGQVATTRLTPGMLLSAGMVEPVGEPGAGRVLVPIAMPAERMPAGGLRAGDRILAVDSEPTGPDTAAAAAAAPTPATVVRVGPADINGVTVVDVTTTAAAGPRLAVAAANGHVAIIVEPVGS